MKMNNSSSIPNFVSVSRLVPKTALGLFSLFLAVGFSSSVAAQEEQSDPATNTNIIDETLRKIREVENLDRYIEENGKLRKENGELKNSIASLQKQVNKLTQEMKVENERLRKQLIQLPTFEVKSKMVSASRAMAVLNFGEKSMRVRMGTKTDVPVSQGVWTLMNVKKITNELVEIEFPELNRTVILYD